MLEQFNSDICHTGNLETAESNCIFIVQTLMQSFLPHSVGALQTVTTLRQANASSTAAEHEDLALGGIDLTDPLPSRKMQFSQAPVAECRIAQYTKCLCGVLYSTQSKSLTSQK